MEPEVTVYGVFGANVTQPAFWAGTLFIAFFALTRFIGQSQPLAYFDPPIPNRHFTTRFRYYLAACVYVLFMVCVYSGLVFIQSFPDVIERLGPLIGPMEDVISARTGFAAVVVAALITVFILPVIGPLVAVDEKVRDLLHNFASLPEKAWMIASQIVEGVDGRKFDDEDRVASLPRELLLDDDAWSDPRVYLAIREKLDRLIAQGPKGSPRYRRFFIRQRHHIDQLDEGFDILHGEFQFTATSRAFYEREMTKLVERISLLFACAVLKIEVDEFKAATLLKNRLNIRGVVVPQFRFTAVQVLWAVGIIGVASVVGMALATFVLHEIETIASANAVRVEGATGAATYLSRANLVEAYQVTSNMVTFALQWNVVTVTLYLLPLMLAVGVQLYITDRRLYGLGGAFRERLLATIFTTVFAFLICAIPLLLAASLSSPDAIEANQQINLGLILPWAFGPTAFATAFVFLSNRGLTKSRTFNALVDFTFLAIVTALGSYFGTQVYYFNEALPFEEIRARMEAGTITAAAALAEIEALRAQLGMDDNPLNQLSKTFVSSAFPISGGFTGGALGAAMLYVSRRRIGRVREAHWIEDEDRLESSDPFGRSAPL